MTFKPKQLDPEAVKVFSESEVGVLLENIDDRLGVIIESQQLLTGRVDKLDAKVDILTETVGDLQVDMTQVKEDVSEIKQNLDRKADRPVVQQLERRVVALEAKP